MGRRGPKIKRNAQKQTHAAGKQGPEENSASDLSNVNGKLPENGNIQRKEIISSKKNGTKNVEDKFIETSADIFPHWLPWLLFPMTLSMRIFYVLEPTNWWILHPDEIYQTMEVAHSDVYGYGFRAYEYLPPPSSDVMNSTTISDAHALEIQYGMYSLRSFILPKLLSIVMILAEMCDINFSPYLIIRLFHVTVSSLLPLVVFQFSRTFHSSRDIGCLSAILVSSSMSLNIFGTHTFINSFLAPVFLLCVEPAVSLLSSLVMLDSQNTKQSELCGLQGPSNSQGESDASDRENTAVCETDFAPDKSILSGQFTQESNNEASSHDENANVICKEKLSNLHVNNFHGFRDAATAVRATERQRHKQHIEGSRTNRSLKQINLFQVLTGLGLSMCIYVRVDLSLVLVLILVGFYRCIFTKISETVNTLKQYCLGVVTGALIGGYCDYVTYERWFFSPYQWYRFNVRNSFAGHIFGVHSCYFYLLKLYQNEPLVAMSFTIILVGTLLNLTRRMFTSSSNHSQPSKNQSFVVFIFLLLAFSLNSHKELRFMHNAIIFMYITVSCAIFSLIEFSKRFVCNQNGRKYSIYIVYIFIVLFISSHSYNFLNMKFEDRAKWSYAKNKDSYETNICLDFIRQQKDVTGVFMDRSIHMSGAYSILHQDVPIIALTHYEYTEYRKSHYLNSVIEPDLVSSQRDGFSTFTNISDFISIYNSGYLFKKISQLHQYNFILIETSNQFPDIAYDEVFRIGNSKVLRRTFEQQKEMELANAMKSMKLVLNATVLEYEGDRLQHYGLYTKAEQRLLMANRIDPKRIGIFRLMLEMYSKLKQTKNYNSVLKTCLQFHRKSACLKPYVPIVLHPGYNTRKIKRLKLKKDIIETR